MIEVRISRNKGNAIAGFQVTGHAGSDDPGKDLVCCAVSSIVQTAVLGLKFIACIKADVIMEKGRVKCSVDDADNKSGDAFLKSAAILDTMLLGLKSIQKNHKDFLSINEGTE